MEYSQTLAALTSPGRGVLVADDYLEGSLRQLGRRRNGLTPEAFVDIALASPGIADVLSGALLSQQTFSRCETRWRDQPRPTSRHVALGIAMDSRLTASGHTTDDPLAAAERRLVGVREAGVTFVEWRAHIHPLTVIRGGTHIDAVALARGASASLRTDVVPIVTVAMPDLGSHSAVVTRAVLTNALRSLGDEFQRKAVDPASVIIRTSFVMAGDRHETRTPPHVVADETCAMLDEALPAEFAAVAFVSGGQSIESASARLAAVCARMPSAALPRTATFAFGRALVGAALTSWRTAPQPTSLQRRLSGDCRLAADATRAPMVAADA